MAVTLTQIINPATGADGPPTDDNGKPNGSYVAAMLTIKNTGKSALEDDANKSRRWSDRTTRSTHRPTAR